MTELKNVCLTTETPGNDRKQWVTPVMEKLDVMVHTQNSLGVTPDAPGPGSS